MKCKIIGLRVCLLVVFCCLSWFAVAQTNDNDKRLLLGEWVWEETSTVENGQMVTFDLYNDYYKLYAEVEVKENTVFLKNRDEKAYEVKYEVDGNYLGIDLPSGKSYIAEWAILDDKLYLEFSDSQSSNVSKKGNLLVTYKRK